MQEYIDYIEKAIKVEERSLKYTEMSRHFDLPAGICRRILRVYVVQNMDRADLSECTIQYEHPELLSASRNLATIDVKIGVPIKFKDINRETLGDTNIILVAISPATASSAYTSWKREVQDLAMKLYDYHEKGEAFTERFLDKDIITKSKKREPFSVDAIKKIRRMIAASGAAISGSSPPLATKNLINTNKIVQQTLSLGNFFGKGKTQSKITPTVTPTPTKPIENGLAKFSNMFTKKEEKIKKDATIKIESVPKSTENNSSNENILISLVNTEDTNTSDKYESQRESKITVIRPDSKKLKTNIDDEDFFYLDDFLDESRNFNDEVNDCQNMNLFSDDDNDIIGNIKNAENSNNLESEFKTDKDILKKEKEKTPQSDNDSEEVYSDSDASQCGDTNVTESITKPKKKKEK